LNHPGKLASGGAAWLLAVALALPVCLSQPAQAQDGTRHPGNVIILPDAPADQVLQMELFDHWFAWKTALEEGDLAAAEPLRQKILSLLSQGSVRGVKILGGASARVGFTLLEAGRTEEAGMAFDLAAQVSPDLPQLHFGRAAVALQGEKDPMGWVRSQMSGLKAQVRGLWGSFFLRANLILVVIGGLLAFTTAYSVAELLKYNRLFRHSLAERFSRRTTVDVAHMLGLAALILPLVFWLGPGFLVLWWLAAMYSYMDVREKTFAWICVLFVALLPLALVYLHGTASILDSPVLRGAQSLTARGADQRTIQELEESLGSRPDDTQLRFLYATVLMKAGRDDTARLQLREVIARDPGYERAWNNLGNIHFREQDYGQAVQQYEKAIDSASCYALAHYNIATTYGTMLLMPLYRRYAVSAAECDPVLVEELRDQQGVVDAHLESEEIMALIRSFEEERTGDAPPKGIASHLANPLTLAAFLVGIYFFLRTGKRRKSSHARACVKCGRPFCSACQPGAEASAYCTQCMHLYIKRDGIAPAVRMKKTQEVERHSSRVRWAGRILNFVLPGSGDLLEGHTLSGLVLLLLWCFIGASLFLAGTLVTFPQQVVHLRSLLLLGSLGAGLVLVWAWANLIPLVARR